GDHNRVEDVFVYDRSIPEPTAASTVYGPGFPGTLGIPGLSSSALPVFGSAVAITIDNSSGNWAPALLAVGFAQANLVTRAGGTLLVVTSQFVVEAIPP